MNLAASTGARSISSLAPSARVTLSARKTLAGRASSITILERPGANCPKRYDLISDDDAPAALAETISRPAIGSSGNATSGRSTMIRSGSATTKVSTRTGPESSNNKRVSLPCWSTRVAMAVTAAGEGEALIAPAGTEDEAKAAASPQAFSERREPPGKRESWVTSKTPNTATLSRATLV